MKKFVDLTEVRKSFNVVSELSSKAMKDTKAGIALATKYGCPTVPEKCSYFYTKYGLPCPYNYSCMAVVKYGVPIKDPIAQIQEPIER